MCEDTNSNWGGGRATFGMVDERKNGGGKKNSVRSFLALLQA